MLMRQKSFGYETLGLTLDLELLRSVRADGDGPIRRVLVSPTAVVSYANMAMTMRWVFHSDMDALCARY